ncbi:MAG TPA: serine hydrolase, partial [Chitinophagaceae bacterium]|nr:serine hydrolase [Chitinophagaceae bacterium]
MSRLLLILFSVLTYTNAFSQHDTLMEKIDREVAAFMRNGDIPGLSMAIVKDGRQIIKNYGYADLEHKTPVTSTTLFEMGSCSKAFTALAVLTTHVPLDDAVTKYLPWLHVYYEGKEQIITI